ncbi:MAG: hypothetical protein P8M65_11010 [Roseibacillus sp.]|jgi:hypothetical protein|nr:hypothetical protein [Roseibacillus sp.]
MIKSTAITVVLLTACSLQSLVQGQDRRERRGGDDKVPAIGSAIPDIDVFDAQGRSFGLREKLKGKHAVLVFGCLT